MDGHTLTDAYIALAPKWGLVILGKIVTLLLFFMASME
jgi:hypothetical protein